MYQLHDPLGRRRVSADHTGIACHGGKPCRKIRRTIETQARSVCPVTVSIGVTLYEGGDYNHAVKKADQALYIAKNSGRNQVCVEESMQGKI